MRHPHLLLLACLLAAVTCAAPEADAVTYRVLEHIDEPSSAAGTGGSDGGSGGGGGVEGTSVAVIDSSAYGGVRYLRHGTCLVGAVFRGAPDESLFTAFSIMGHAVCRVAQSLRATAPQQQRQRSLLVLGLGAGTAPLFAARRCLGRRWRVDAVERSAAVVRLAQRHFGYGLGVEVAEARAYVFRRGEEEEEGLGYDVVLQDLFVGHNPAHMLTAEAFRRVRAHVLRAGSGVHIVNFVGFSHGPDAAFSRSVARTLREVFAHVDCYRDSPLEGAALHEPCNVLCFGTDRAALTAFGEADPEKAVLPSDQLPHGWHSANFQHWRVLDGGEGDDAVVLRDGASLDAFADALQRASAYSRDAVRSFLREDLWE